MLFRSLFAYGLRLGGYLAIRERKSSSYKKKMQGEIKDAVTGELWQKIEHSYSTIATRTAAEREQAFAAGFRTAMTMMVCGLSAPKPNKDGGK